LYTILHYFIFNVLCLGLRNVFVKENSLKIKKSAFKYCPCYFFVLELTEVQHHQG